MTRSEKFGEFAEALAIGDLVKFVPGLGAAERPSDNVQTILREIRVWKTIATDAESQVIRGTWTQTFAIDQVTEAENNIQRIQSRIRLLIQSSPELKFNSDGVNFIETKIFEAETRIFNAKLAINAGVSADPNDIQILIELQRSIDVEEFDIPGL